MSKIVKIDNKYYDFGTKNKSFLQTAQELKILGIKNWYICLEVKYPQLGVQDIDAWDENITAEQIGRILIESRDNVWFFIREVAKIPAKGAPTPFDPLLTRASHAAIWCYEHNIDFKLCQPRQTHKTTFIELIMVHAFTLSLNNVNIPFLHIKDSRAQDNVRMFRDYITDGLPPYMNPWLHDKRPPGLKSLRYEAHKIGIKPMSKAASADKAMDLLRGETVYVVFGDEWEYIDYIDSIMSGAAPAMHSARDIAKNTGVKTCVVLASTPGNLDTTTGKAAQKMIDSTPRFSERFYDLTPAELTEMFSDMTSGDMEVTSVYVEFNWKQLRKTEQWVREQYEDALKTGKLDEFRRGVLLQRYRGSDKVLFRQEDVDYIVQHMRTPDYEMMLVKKYVLYVYRHQIQTFDLMSDTPFFDINIPYLVGIDVSTGSGGDNTAFVIVHPYTLEIVGELKSPFMSTNDAVRVITELASLMPKCIFCLESNSIGKAIVAFAEESPLIYRFYHDPKLDITKNATTIDYSQLSLEQRSQNRQYIGTTVTPGVRNTMMELLKRYVRDYHSLLISRFLVEDITKLTINKSGKIEAESGEHDDIVMAYLHTIYILTYGHDLTRFGINKALCSYEEAFEVLDDYEESTVEKQINNMVPYDCPTLYEHQLLNDLISRNSLEFKGEGGVDVYGYTREMYDRANNTGRSSNDNCETLSAADLAWFSSMN
ncbi:MAG: hypothetical protein IKA36_00115 [Clostridia bacterium]|nr:hypothetical protein [Clostridia bacterium]